MNELVTELCDLIKASVTEARNGTGFFGPNCGCNQCTRWRRMLRIVEQIAPEAEHGRLRKG